MLSQSAFYSIRLIDVSTDFARVDFVHRNRWACNNLHVGIKYIYSRDVSMAIIVVIIG